MSQTKEQNTTTEPTWADAFRTALHKHYPSVRIEYPGVQHLEYERGILDIYFGRLDQSAYLFVDDTGAVVGLGRWRSEDWAWLGCPQLIAWFGTPTATGVSAVAIPEMPELTRRIVYYRNWHFVPTLSPYRNYKAPNGPFAPGTTDAAPPTPPRSGNYGDMPFRYGETFYCEAYPRPAPPPKPKSKRGQSKWSAPPAFRAGFAPPADADADPETARLQRLALAMDHHGVLGVDEWASEEEIRTAYKKLSLKYHPDKNFGDEEGAEVKFKIIKDAYETLSK